MDVEIWFQKALGYFKNNSRLFQMCWFHGVYDFKQCLKIFLEKQYGKPIQIF